MKKAGSYNNLIFKMEKTNSYGCYLITGRYRGKEIKAFTTDSQAWDWLDDDSDKDKRDAARLHCYVMIRDEYDRQEEEERRRAYTVR